MNIDEDLLENELHKICAQTSSKDAKERLSAVNQLDHYIQSGPEDAVSNQLSTYLLPLLLPIYSICV